MIAAVNLASARVDLDATGATVIKHSNNTIVLLPVERLVAKVSRACFRDAIELRSNASCGSACISPLMGRGSPRPLDPDVAGPHRIGDAVLTLWRYRQPQPPPSDLAELGGVVRGFHSALAELAADLPTLADKIDDASALLRDRDRTPGLTNQDRRAAARAEPRIHELLDPLAPDTALHGEPHDGNVIWTGDGPLLIDFEASCTGPLEWDLAYLRTKPATPSRIETRRSSSGCAPPSATA